MKTIPKIAILGGGIGGLVCASELNYRLGSKAEITLFDRSPFHTYQPAFLHLAFGQRKLDSIRRPFESLTRQGINFLKGEIFRVDVQNLVINAEHGDFEFDYMIIALGAQLDPDAIEGFEDTAINLYTAEGSQKVNKALADFTGGKVTVAISSMPYKCPAAPYEMAFLLDSWFRQKGIRKKVELSIVTPEPFPMPVAGPTVGGKVVGMLEASEIDYLPNEQIKSFGKSLSLKKKRLKSDLVIGIPPHVCPDVLVETSVAKKNGWVPVDKHTMETDFENVYAVGDSTVIMLANGKALPKAGVFAKSEAQTVAYNLAHKISGSSSSRKFDGYGSCFLETGNKKAAYAKGQFYHEPDPAINLKQPSMMYYYFKKLYEKYWLKAWI